MNRNLVPSLVKGLRRKSLHKVNAGSAMKTLGYLYICGFTAEEACGHPSEDRNTS